MSSIRTLASGAALAFLLTATASACSGGVGGTVGGTSGSSGTSGGIVRAESTYCSDRETLTKACAADSGVDAGSITFDQKSCGEEYRCYGALLASPDAYLACRTNPDCSASKSKDTCLAKAGEGRTTDKADACAKKYAECKAAGGKSFDDETCAALRSLAPDPLAKVAACLDKPCDQVSACMDATVTAISPDCK